jgi:hypothetical protein
MARVIAAVVLLFGALPSEACSQHIADAEEVATRYVRAFYASDWKIVHGLTDSASLAELIHQERLRWSPRRSVPPVTPNADDLMRSDPEMPEGVAQYLASRYARGADTSSAEPALIDRVAGVRTRADVALLSDAELYRRLLDRALPGAPRRQESCGDLDGVAATRRYSVQGAVTLKDGSAAVLFSLETSRGQVLPPGSGQLRVLRLVRSNDRWRVLPDTMNIAPWQETGEIATTEICSTLT